MYSREEIQSAIDWLGETDNWHPKDCEMTDNGEVWYGLIQLLPARKDTK